MAIEILPGDGKNFAVSPDIDIGLNNVQGDPFRALQQSKCRSVRACLVLIDVVCPVPSIEQDLTHR